MTGSLQIKSGKFFMVFPYRDSLGKWHQRAETTGLTQRGNKRKAQAILEARLLELSAQSELAIAHMDDLFLDFMSAWLEDVVARDIRPNTLAQYRLILKNSIRQFPPFAHVTLQKLTPALLQAYINEKLKGGLSAVTIRKHYSNLHKCLDYAVRLGFLQYNPASQVVLPRKGKFTGAVVYTPAQLRSLCQLFQGDPLESAVMLAVTYGMRRSEICGLHWSAVDFTANTLFVCATAIASDGAVIYSSNTKTATSRRYLPLTPTMRTYLLDIQSQQEANKQLLGRGYRENDLVCVLQDGTPINPDFVTHHFQRKVKASDLPPCRFHDLRHSAVNTLRQGRCDPREIQGWLGHSDLSTTLGIYGHLMEGDMGRMGHVMDAALGGI